MNLPQVLNVRSAKHAAQEGTMSDEKMKPHTTSDEKKQDEKNLEQGVEDTFPASDPPSETQPGGGVTELEKIDPAKIPRN
jgi:hypothetical protein